jgi:hypothetical protein
MVRARLFVTFQHQHVVAAVAHRYSVLGTDLEAVSYAAAAETIRSSSSSSSSSSRDGTNRMEQAQLELILST